MTLPWHVKAGFSCSLPHVFTLLQGNFGQHKRAPRSISHSIGSFPEGFVIRQITFLPKVKTVLQNKLFAPNRIRNHKSYIYFDYWDDLEIAGKKKATKSKVMHFPAAVTFGTWGPFSLSFFF